MQQRELQANLSKFMLTTAHLITVLPEISESVRTLSARDIMRLPREERTIIMAEQAELMRRHYVENPYEILPDVLDDIFEETA